MILPLIFVGVAALVIGLYMTINAAWEFNAGMWLKGSIRMKSPPVADSRESGETNSLGPYLLYLG
jgi:hypothetical protein